MISQDINNMSENKPILILDYDGTLHNAAYIYEPAFRSVMGELQEEGIIPHEEYSSEEISYWIGFSAKEMWEKFHPELDEAIREAAGRRIGDKMMEAVRNGRAQLYPGTEAVLDELKKEHTLYFLSNCLDDYAAVHRECFGLDRWFSEYFCTGYYGYRQKEEVFAENIYKPGQSYIAIGDRIKDIRLASECGLHSVACLYGFGSEEELKTADVMIKDISELPDAVGKIELMMK